MIGLINISLFVLVIALVLYLIIGAVAYSKDYFDGDHKNLDAAIKYTLIGSAIIAIRAYTNCKLLLTVELEKSKKSFESSED